MKLPRLTMLPLVWTVKRQVAMFEDGIIWGAMPSGRILFNLVVPKEHNSQDPVYLYSHTEPMKTNTHHETIEAAQQYAERLFTNYWMEKARELLEFSQLETIDGNAQG